MGKDKETYNAMLEDFFLANPNIHHCFAINSRAYVVGEFILETNRKDVQIMGYDMLPKKCRMYAKR